MPNDFGMNNANGPKSLKLDLGALGDAVNQSVNMEAGEKPILNEPTEATIVGVDFRLMNDLRANQNDPAVKYFNTILAVETEFTYTNENGEEVKATSRDNYGGLRFYPELDENNNPIVDANGQPQLKRLWSSNNSAFGKLFETIQKHDNSVRSYSDFFNFMKEGVKVVILNQPSNYQGKQHDKNIIQEFL